MLRTDMHLNLVFHNRSEREIISVRRSDCKANIRFVIYVIAVYYNYVKLGFNRIVNHILTGGNVMLYI